MASSFSLWAEFLPWVLPFVPGCPDPVAEDKVRDKAIEFFKRTRCWRDDIDPISLVANLNVYDLIAMDGVLVTELFSLQCQGVPMGFKTQKDLDNEFPTWRLQTADRPTMFFLPNEREVQVVFMPNQALSNALTGQVAFKPSQDGTGIPTLLWEEHRTAIANGALGELLKMPKTSWFDAALAIEREVKFEKAVVEARNLAIRGNMRRKPLCATPQKYGF